MCKTLWWDARTLRDSANVKLQTDVGDVDLLTTVPGVGDYAQVRSAAQPVDLGDGITIAALDLPELLASKQATNRPKDRLVVPLIEAALHLRDMEQEQRSPQD